jgi:hypothetical protein
MAANEQADRGGRQLGVFIIVHRLISGSEETYRRVGVCKASSTSSRPPGHYRRVEKQPYFSRRRYANAPTRFPFPDL